MYEIIMGFDSDSLANKISRIFKAREEYEIQRIHNMVAFFESESCMHRRLAGYFGETIAKENCGHCSFCKGGKATIRNTTTLPLLSDYNFEELTRDFIQAVGDRLSVFILIKFLCGISTPVFTKFKIKSLPYFGVFARYPFIDIKNWVEARYLDKI